MKNLLLPVFVILVYHSTLAQWNPSGATAAVTIYRTGNVGIGPETTIPGYASLYLSNGGGLNPNLMFRNSDAAVDNRIWSVMAQAGNFRILTQTDAGGSVQDAFVIARSGVNVSSVAFPNGNVLIGTNTLEGSYGTSRVLQMKGDGTWLVMSGSSTTSFNLSNSSWGTGLYSWGGPFTFWTSPSGIGSQRMIIRADGNVGIGTSFATNPNSYKLAVNGKIGAKEVQLENTSSTWADYVFESDYKLLPLCDVESFIKTNKHLPEIPSAEEVKTNGHKLGEMDVLLLKKVEELTLYVIELEKKINALENSKK